jgi:hypothetical protein
MTSSLIGNLEKASSTMGSKHFNRNKTMRFIEEMKLATDEDPSTLMRVEETEKDSGDLVMLI